VKQERSYNRKSQINNYVNKLQPYELLIAEELEQAQVPDRADAIWTIIEKGLDLDLPTGNGPSQPPSPPSPGAGWGKGFLLLAGGTVIVAMTVLLLSKDETNPSQPRKPEVIIPLTTKPSDSNQEEISLPGSSQQPARNGIMRPGPGMLIDSSEAPVVIVPPMPVVADSTNNTLPLVVPTVRPDSVATVPSLPPPSRQRGVKGIRDSDYKIVAGKKDST
jgi:hypothetical protein